MSMIGYYISIPSEEIEQLDDEEFLTELLEEQNGHPGLCIEKSWQAIHYVLNGDAWQGTGPLFNAVLGGKQVGEDLGYGPARLLTPDEVNETSKALGAISPDDFSARVTKTDFAAGDVYVYENEVPEKVAGELTEYFTDLREFFKETAQKRNGMLIYLG